MTEPDELTEEQTAELCRRYGIDRVPGKPAKLTPAQAKTRELCMRFNIPIHGEYTLPEEKENDGDSTDEQPEPSETA